MSEGGWVEYVNRGILVWVTQDFPLQREVRCVVPGCPRTWYLSGPRQGFVLSGVIAHGLAHGAGARDGGR